MYRKPWPRPDQAKAQPNPAQAKALACGLACDIGKPKPFKARPKPSHLAWPVILESPSPSKPGQSPQSQAKPGPNNTRQNNGDKNKKRPDLLQASKQNMESHTKKETHPQPELAPRLGGFKWARA